MSSTPNSIKDKRISMRHLLEVKDLEVKFALWSDELTAIDGISFTLDRGELLGIVGESGAGKSVTGFAKIGRAHV